MNSKEKNLFLALCDFSEPDGEEIAHSIRGGAATPEVLGMLFSNRMAGIAYETARDTQTIGLLDREFRNSLKLAHTYNTKYNADYSECVKFLKTVLSRCTVPYLFLKGAYLYDRYPVGCRTSNDIDLLALPGDISQISEVLKDNGFEQGYIKNGYFVPASRAQIIESKVMRGETVPFIKKVDLPYIKYLEVDLNFSLDYKNGGEDKVDNLLKKRQQRGTNNIYLPDEYDFILYLCAHLYKEATVYPWVQMKRDMTFYKFSDIKLLLESLSNDDTFYLIQRADELGLLGELAYALAHIRKFSTNFVPRFDLKIGNELHTVIYPEKKKRFIYTEHDLIERFFSSNRASLLKEVIS